MPPITVNIPNNVLEALNQRKGDNLSAFVAELLAKGLGVDYTPAKQGGQRVPKALTAEQIAQIKVLPPTLSKETKAKEPIVLPAALGVGKKRFVRNPQPTVQHAKPVKRPYGFAQSTLAAQGYPYAEIFKANNRYTGKLFKGDPALPRADCRYEYVGSMTLADFEKACGRKATFEGME